MGKNRSLPLNEFRISWTFNSTLVEVRLKNTQVVITLPKLNLTIIAKGGKLYHNVCIDSHLT